MPDAMLLWAALASYALVALMAVPAMGLPWRSRTRRAQAVAALALAAALALHTLSLGLRWSTLGHGPFTTMHEILSSNLWSLALVFALAWWAVRELRGALLLVMPVLASAR